MCGKTGWCKCKKSNDFHPENLENNREKFLKRLRDRAKAEKLQHKRSRPKRDQKSSKKANENPTEQVTDSSTEEEDEV